MVEIKDISGKTRFSTPINNGAKGKFTLMKEDYIILPFSVPSPIPFKLGDYADLTGILDESLGGKLAKVYEITDLQKPTYNTSTGGYDYQLRLDAYYWKWKNKIFKYTPEKAGNEASWSLTASLDVHLGVVLRNLKALGYTYKGTEFTFSIDSTVEDKAVAITYDNINILDALFTLASKENYNCDCWITDNVIHFGRNEFGDAVKIERGVEASSVTHSESQGTYATRIFAFGSTKNIPTNYRPTDEQAVINGVVQKRLMLPADTPYIDAYEGMSQEEAIEDVVIFDDVFPRRVGELFDVHTRTEEVDNEDGTKETVTYYRYKDTGLEFKEEYIIEGQELKIQFQSGKLNGMEFGVIFNPEPKDESRGKQLWEIVRNENYGRMLPDEIMFPANGDKYILSGFDIQLVSDLYIPEAEQELKEKALKYAQIAMKDDGTYPTTLRSSWVKEDLISRTFEFGQRINLVDDTYFENGRISRVLGWELNLDIPWDSPIYTIGESMPYSRIQEIEDKVDALTYKGQTYTGGGGSGVYIIRTNDSTAPSDSNVFSALRSLATFLRKDQPDSTKYLLSLLGGTIFGKNGFASGLTGFGAKIDDRGYGEMRGLTLWEWLQVPELRFNRVDVYLGIKWRTPGGGIIETCTPDQDSEGNELTTGTCTLKLEEGELGAVSLDDIALGIYHFGNEKDATEDSDDGQGNFSFAGFATSYFRITEVIGNDHKEFRYSLRPGYTIHPQPQMHISCYGNFTNEDRQKSVYETREYTRMLWKQNTWTFGLQNIAMQFGDLSNLNVFGLNMSGYSMYLNSVYFTGVVSQVKPDGTPVMTANDRGAWQNDTKYDYYDRVSHKGCIWLCVNEDGTNTEPSDENTNWLKQVDKGEAGQDGTSFKILGSKNDESELPQSGNSIGDSYLINGDLWVWTAENVWKNVGNIQGPAGESVKPMGNWYNGMTVPYLGVIRMGSATFMCTNQKGTTNPPMWIWTDKDTNRFIYSDNGYVLTGDINSTDYVIIAEDGTDAVKIIKVDVEYAITTSNTVAPTSGWQTLAPQWENGKYIWSRSVTYYSDGNKTITEAACISGGKGIKRIVEYYYRSTSATELIGGEWSTTCPEWINGTYIWTKSVIEYTDGTTDEEGEMNSTGAQGESPVIADLDNEMESVPLDFEGYTTQVYTIQSTLSIWFGSKKSPISEINISSPDNITTSYELSTGVITVEIAKGVKLQDMSRLDITASSNINGQKYTRNVVLSIVGVKAGSQGEDAILYKLLPSVSSIVKKKDGTYSTNSISCSRVKSQGSNNTITTDGVLKYKIDNSTETITNNDTPIQVESIRYSISFLFYINNTLVDKETIPMIEDGIDGEGFTNLGKWYTGLLVPKMGVVVMGGSSWVATTATRNPPMWCWTDKDGNRFIFNDNTYVLTGEQNTSEYDLMAEKGEDGKDGIDGEDGKDGMDGLPGKDGTDYEYIYKRTTTYSRPSTPTSEQENDYVPSDWTDNPQGVSMTYMYEWVCKRNKQNGKWSDFSTPALWAKYGEQGDQGALPRYRGVYKSSESYIYGMEDGILIRDIVVLNSTIYQVATRGDIIQGIAPPNSRWQEASKFDFVAMDTALIDNANIGGFIFRRLGWLSDGSPYGELRSQNNGTDGNPMLQMFTKTGKLICQDVDIKGNVTATGGSFYGEVTATSGSIGGIKIENGYIGTIYSSNGLYISNDMVSVRYSKTTARIGYDVGNVFTLGSMAGYFSCEETHYTGDYSPNVGLNVYATGAIAKDDLAYSGNHALYITKGDICGFRLRTRRVNASMTLDKMDSNIIAVTKDITLTLPTSDVEDGQMYFIRNLTDGNVRINGRVSVLDDPSITGSYADLGAGYLAILMYDKVNNKWLANRCDNW